MVCYLQIWGLQSTGCRTPQIRTPKTLLVPLTPAKMQEQIFFWFFFFFSSIPELSLAGKEWLWQMPWRDAKQPPQPSTAYSNAQLQSEKGKWEWEMHVSRCFRLSSQQWLGEGGY